jgi:hypothetical protein
MSSHLERVETTFRQGAAPDSGDIHPFNRELHNIPFDQYNASFARDSAAHNRDLVARAVLPNIEIFEQPNRHAQVTPASWNERENGMHRAPHSDRYASEGEGTAAEKKEMATLVADVAAKMGMSKHDTLAAVAAMLYESGGNPHNRGDFMHGRYTSFGLFQLHRGGELTEAHLTERQAFDPRTNVTTALSYFKEHAGSYRGYGQLAAAAQRPKHPAAYAQVVDRLVPEARRLLDW